MQIYTLLGIQSNATEAEIKKAYRKLALKYHPDRNLGNAQAEQKFIAINKAYQLALKNVTLVKQNHYRANNYQSQNTQQNNTAQQNQQQNSSSNRSRTHYKYKHTYYDFHKNNKKEEKQEFDWDKVHNKYSNAGTNKKAGQTQRKAEPKKQNIVVEESETDFTKIILYLIAGLVGLLVYTLTENVMWGTTSVFIGISAILLSKLFESEESVY